MKAKLLALALGLLAPVGAVPVAWGQSIDYGAMEQLFGEPVTTSVTGSPQRASDVPANMEIITADDIRRSGATDIPGVLRHVAGINVWRWTNDNADVGIRGYNQAASPRLLVLIDGRQVYADYYGYTPWSALPVELDAIRQIELVKGPNSALFGFNAVDGVINIITYNPRYDDINTATLNGGTQNLVRGSAVGTLKLGDAGGVRISAGGRANDDFATRFPAPFTGVRRGDDRGAIDVHSVLRVGDHADLTLAANHVTADQSEITAGQLPVFTRYATNSVRAQLNADTATGLWQATAYTNWITAAYQVDPIVGIPDETFHNRVTVLQLQDSLKLNAEHTVRGTVEYRHNTEGTTSIGGASLFYDNIAVGGMWQWQIAPTLSLTNALRVDHLMLGRSGTTPPGYPFTNAAWNRDITAESFNSGIVWKADDENTLRVLAGRGVQLPDLASLGAAIVGAPGGFFTGRPTLRPTVVTNYELAWDRDLKPIDARLRVAAFHQVTDDISTINAGLLLTPTGFIFTSANVVNSKADGIEIELKGKFGTDWRWNLSYTPEIVTDRFFPGFSNLTTTTDFEHTNPVHAVKTHLGWSHGAWEADAYLTYQSHAFGLVGSPSSAATATLVPIADYVVLDGRVGYKLTDRVTLALSGQNIAASPQQQTSGPKVERRVLGWVTVKF